MTEEYEMKLFDRWTETMDKEEYVTLGLRLFPEATREELEANFEKAMAGYREASAAGKVGRTSIS